MTKAIEHVSTLGMTMEKDGSEVCFFVEVDYNFRRDRSGNATTPNGPDEIDIHNCRLDKIEISMPSCGDGLTILFPRGGPNENAGDYVADTLVYSNLDDVEDRIRTDALCSGS